MPMARRAESELYLPVKRFLEEQGYTVRAEVNGCDIVAVRGEDVVLVELKTTFNLALVFQGIDRQTVSDNVFLAVEAPRGRRSRTQGRDVRRLCGRLGLGLLFVHFPRSGEPQVEAACEPHVAAIRRNTRKKALLRQEFDRRSGDHNVGGSARRSNTGRPTVTAYRQDALRIARYIQRQGTVTPREVRVQLGIPGAPAVLQKNYYGWFTRVDRGVYSLSPAGIEGLQRFADVVGVLEQLEDATDAPEK